MRWRAAILALLTLNAGCYQSQPAVKADDRICLTPGPLSGDAWRGCIHKWAYRMAGAPDAANIVARGVVGACMEPIKTEIDNIANTSKIYGEAYRELGDREFKLAANDAVFRVVQARAGHCPVPE